jgi:hypothetical protein
MGATQLILRQTDVQLALIVLTLWVGELAIICLVLLVERKRRKLAKDIQSVMTIVEVLRRSEETRSLRKYRLRALDAMRPRTTHD